VDVERIIHWLEKFLNVCLVVHNGRRFDLTIFFSILVNVSAIDILYNTVLLSILYQYSENYIQSSP